MRSTRPGGLFVLVSAASAVLFVTLALRVPTTSVGPVLQAIGTDTGYSPQTLALLTSVPLLCFLVAAPATPVLARCVGMGRLLIVALGATAAGTLVRSLAGGWSLAVGTILLGFAVAIVSVLAPAAVRTLGSGHHGWFSALYTASLSLGPAMAAGLTVPLTDLLSGSWRGALASWVALPVLAIICWTVARVDRLEAAPRGRDDPPRRDVDDDSSAQDSDDGSFDPASAAHSSRPDHDDADVGLWDVLRDPAAWGIAGILGMSSLLFYTMTAWLPSIFMDLGASPAGAGATAALVNIVAIPASFAGPIAVRRMRSPWVPPVLAPLPIALGAVLLAIAPSASTGAAVLLGIGQGASVGIAYALVLLAAHSTSHATAVSSLSQTVGVTLAALGPVAIAAVHDATGGWTPAILCIAGLAVAQAVLGGLLTRRRNY